MTAHDLIEHIESMTVLELVELKGAIEARWGVTSWVAPSVPSVTVDLGMTDAAEEQVEFVARLESIGANKIAVIKVVREVTNLGLKEAKEFVESAPVDVKIDVSKDEAEMIAAKLRQAGAEVSVQ